MKVDELIGGKESNEGIRVKWRSAFGFKHLVEAFYVVGNDKGCLRKHNLIIWGSLAESTRCTLTPFICPND